MFKYWDIMDTVITALILLVLSIVLPAIFADHSIQCYYLETEAQQSGYLVYNIKGKRNWAPDQTTFKSLNFDETFQIFKELDNKCVGK